MSQTDQMLARLAVEAEEKQQFVDNVIEDAEKAGRDLTEQELELVTRSRDRQQALAKQMEPLQDARRIAATSADRIAEISRTMQSKPVDNDVQYRSAGAYILDYWQARIGNGEAMRRLEMYERTAAHMVTTSDSAGVLPEPVVQPIVNFVDAARPLVSALGPRNLPSKTWTRPKVTQHTAVLEQSAEKAELNSQKMIISEVTGTSQTFGTYVNVARQLIDFASPDIMDIIINDMAQQYALVTENDATDTFLAGATAATTNLATGANTAAQVAAAFWGAVGQVYSGTKGAGRVIAAMPPQMLSLVGPLFAPVNPENAQSQGFNAVNYGQGPAGAISRCPHLRHRRPRGQQDPRPLHGGG